jgi:hypothetical protein
VTTDTTDNKGKPAAGPGAKGGKDLDDLKARLGLKKGPEAAAPGAAGAAGGQQQAKQAQSSLEDFKFSFGQKPAAPAAAEMSDKEFEAIEKGVAKSATPWSMQLIKWAAGGALVAILMWIGYQYGNSMGLRVIHNESVSQAQRVRDIFTKSFTDGTGTEVSSRRDATAALADALATYTDERAAKFTLLAEALGKGQFPPDFDIEAFRKEDIDPLKRICETYMTAVEQYSVDALLQGQLYATELGSKLLEFVNRANSLRSKVEQVYILLQLMESLSLPEAPPSNLKPKLLLLASKAETDKDKVLPVTSVDIDGTPEVDRELVTKEICEPVSMEIEIPVCNPAKGQPETEKRLLEVFEKKEAQEVKPFRKVKVKTEGESKSLTAKIGDLFELDMRPYLMPLLDRLGADRSKSALNVATLFNAFVANLMAVREAAPEVDYRTVVEMLDTFASQETYFAF